MRWCSAGRPRGCCSHAVAAPDIKLDVQFAADARAAVPAVGDRINLDYDPANAVVVPAA